jgi:hypothetical protein
MAELNEFFGADGFDADKVASADVLPAGNYRACITSSSIRESKQTPGARYIAFEISILQPVDFNGRKLFVNCNIGHTKDNVKAIAERQLKQICEAIGVTKIDRTDVLHNKPLLISVIVKDGDRGQQNEVKRFSSLAASAAQGEGAATASAPQQERKFF